MSTIMTCIILIIVVGIAIYQIVHKKKSGTSSCSGDCSSCNTMCTAYQSNTKDIRK